MTKKARIYNGEKTVSSINGARKTGQLHVEEWNSNIFWYHLQKYTQNGLKA